MPGPTGIPIPQFVIPRLVIMHTTFHGSEDFLHFAQFLRSGGSHGFGKVSFVGCTFEGMTREAFQTILKIIGCLVFCKGCRGRVDVSGDGM
ncbi:hypothetical protein FA95DRAFT_1555454 [Auriscalpium vulgare]|uniref:Uncharacterized protein n=1 Tax=Auriscalpium vulgare TaxID=40419 RepID=A0ACB8S2E9_9AGAM|nr:hypothetical protein FA95DRAFT_1555454 [Auriscalpium vulgare]